MKTVTAKAVTVGKSFIKYLPLLFLMSCVPNAMHSHILDNKEVTHIYLSDDIHSGSNYWCVRHGMMEKIEIKKPNVSSR